MKQKCKGVNYLKLAVVCLFSSLSQSLSFLTQQEAGAHPITGIIVLVLAVIQPIMALFRPHPGEAKYVDWLTSVTVNFLSLINTSTVIRWGKWLPSEITFSEMTTFWSKFLIS